MCFCILYFCTVVFVVFWPSRFSISSAFVSLYLAFLHYCIFVFVAKTIFSLLLCIRYPSLQHWYPSPRHSCDPTFSLSRPFPRIHVKCINEKMEYTRWCYKWAPLSKNTTADPVRLKVLLFTGFLRETWSQESKTVILELPSHVFEIFKCPYIKEIQHSSQNGLSVFYSLQK